MPASRILLVIGVVAAVSLVGATAFLSVSGDGSGDAAERGIVTPSGRRVFASNDAVERACLLNPKILVRLWRGLYRERGGDLMIVPQKPNYAGGFVIPGHTGPWAYLQDVPLVLYGPERIAARGVVVRHANITDVFPTAAELTGVELPQRDGDVLHEALRTGARGATKLIVTVVWDGVGNNVLARWPDRWPVLRSLMERGTSYVNATVGSSPSITPATHASLGTGSFPRAHGVTAINLRSDDGEMTSAFAGRDPGQLELTTYTDEIDRAYDNDSRAGMLAWKAWHMGMLGSGTAARGGDADTIAFIGSHEGDITGSPRWYSTPSFLHGFPGLQRHAQEVDRRDGKADGKWLGHDLLELHGDPAWAAYTGDIVLAMLERGGYGADEVPDLFSVNFKPTDIAGHQYTMESREMADVLEEQDRALGRIVDYLEREVGDYVVVLTSDHGHTPPASVTGGWPVGIKQLRDDINEHFDVPRGETLIEATSPAGLFFDHATLRARGVSQHDITEYVNAYTIRDNWQERELPDGFTERGHEHVFSAAFLRTEMPAIMECAFGRRTPPPGFEA